MDKYEYKVRSEEIKTLISQGKYDEAVKIADSIDWRRVKSVMMLCTISDLYKINRRYEDSRDILLLAYERHTGGRLIVYSLCELSIKLGEYVQALEYYKEFVQLAPKDSGRYVLQYKLYEAQEVSLEERIEVLEELKKRDYREKWAYELAYLYHRVGLASKCVEECDEMFLWFGEGRHVLKGLELKMLHGPLSPEQQEKYNRRFEKSNETEEYMPYSISLAHKLALQLTKVRKDGTLSYLRPDGKSQVSVEYDEEGRPVRLEAVVLSTQHDPDVTQEQIHEDIKKYVFDPILPKELLDENTKYFINPTGRFVIGGPHGDAGLTGRKIIVDTYGGYARHGGGAFSGKDCTKVDRSAAYAARYVAKNIVGAGLADKCEIQLSYAIGVAQPTSIMVDTFKTGKVSDERLVEIIRENFDLRPAGIIKMLDLRRPIYKQTAAYGHFGRNDLDLPWEKLDKVDALKKYL